jgi:hypothetical protein
VGGATCQQCSKEKVVARRPCRQEVVVYYGTIASGNQVIRDATIRDRVSAELGCVLCFEMEAAGLMNRFPCLIVRRICDYDDSHKNNKWQAYAAGTAAACAKEVLTLIPPAEVAKTNTLHEALAKNSDRCGGKGMKEAVVDISSDDSTGDESGAIYPRRIQCFSCQEYGHIAKDCPDNACYN